MFWPDRNGSEALHNLRVNLHRVRGLVQGWGQPDALRTERSRVRLDLPTDLARLADAAERADAVALAAHAPSRWLEGFRIAGFDEFRDWAAQERQRLMRLWAPACERAIAAALERGDAAPALALFGVWFEAGPGAAPVLLALDPRRLGDAARTAWQQMRTRLQAEAADGAEPGSAAASPTRPEPASLLPGRAAEQAELRRGQVRATVVLGEAGVGKTSLLRSVFPQALLLRDREGLDAVPYGPLVDCLQAQRGLLRDLGAYRLDIARVLPDVAPDEPLPSLDAHTAKLQLLEGLARVFEAAVRRDDVPVLLVDDLQWCDSATLEWLVFLAHRGRLRWFASARPHELGAAARQALQSLRAASLLRELPLNGLVLEPFAALCRQRWPALPWSPAQLEALCRRSAGNPFMAGELVAAGLDALVPTGRRGDTPLPPRVRELIQRRVRALPADARVLLESAAVLARHAPLHLLSIVGGQEDGPCVQGCEDALAAELLIEDGVGMECRHDLIREAVLAGLSTARRQWLHRRAALALGAHAAPLEVAFHWEQAAEPQTALAWRYRGALQLRDSGRFDEAQLLWRHVAAESLDATLALRARLALAECELLSDLPCGRLALEAVLQQVAAVADPLLHDELEAQALAGLIDNAVFAGDQPRARTLALRLRPLLPRLRVAERAHCCEVLIELAMREPDIEGALQLLEQARQADPRRPSLLSYAAQIHWFGGRVRDARDAFEAMLETHPDHCRGLTIENDLAVMRFALGDLAGAEAMVRRSLASWRGVAHTEALSLLVLGSVLTSAGRHDEAARALIDAERLARQQSSDLFLAEAQTRRARLLMHCGRFDDALALLALAAPLTRAGDDPLRVSQHAVTQAVCLAAAGLPIDDTLLGGLQALSWRSNHPVVHARLARISAEAALQQRDALSAAEAAARLVAIARDAGLMDPLAEGLLLQARAAEVGGEPAAAWTPFAREALQVAEACGALDLAWRAATRLARAERDRALESQALRLAEQLAGDAVEAPFDARAAARREPRCD